MKIEPVYIILTFYFLSGIVMMAVGQFAIDDLPLVTAGFVIAMVSSIVTAAMKINKSKTNK